MVDGRHPNLEILSTAVERLGSLADDLVFLGGCATGLLLTDPAAPQVRVTQDVDVIAEATSLVDYHHLSERLRRRGFVEDQSEGAPVCRWISGNLILDVMPTNPEILGFGNRWFEPALKSAEIIELPSGKRIRMVSPPFFLATKLEAFDGRGHRDFVLSSDLEDIVVVLDGRAEVVDEVRVADIDLQDYLKKRFTALLNNKDFVDALAGHLPGDTASQQRLPIIKQRLEAIAAST